MFVGDQDYVRHIPYSLHISRTLGLSSNILSLPLIFRPHMPELDIAFLTKGIPPLLELIVSRHAEICAQPTMSTTQHVGAGLATRSGIIARSASPSKVSAAMLKHLVSSDETPFALAVPRHRVSGRNTSPTLMPPPLEERLSSAS